MDEGLKTFAKDLLEEVLAEAGAAEGGEFREAVFFRQATDIMVEADACMNPIPCHFAGKGMKVNGYDYEEDSDSLSLYVVDFDGTDPTRTTNRSDVEAGLRRLVAFFEKAMAGLSERIEESAEAYDMVQMIRACKGTLRRARLFFLTNAIVKPFTPSEETHGPISIEFHIWDIEKLFQVVSRNLAPPAIEIDFRGKYGATIPCLTAPETNEFYDVYLAIVPGSVLSKIYGDYGQRLLERNVRAFLQTKVKVNQGIMTTLKSDPAMFLAYNNGISATADHVTMEMIRGGQGCLTYAKHLQIVNGGQTTASIYHAESKQGVDLSKVFVQMKLSVIKQQSIKDEIVSKISRYANTQTKINASDFESNDAFHVALEQISRKLWVPNPRGKATTKWFYERSRGSYLDEIGRQATPTLKQKFKLQCPSKQKIKKTEMAKYEMAWMQEPHTVCLGSEKNFAHLTEMLAKRQGKAPDDRYFEHLVAKAILFKECDSLARQQSIEGYKAQVVAYCVASLSHLTAQRLDLDDIWKQQDISASTKAALQTLMPLVQGHIGNPPRAGMNISEWSKKENCWTSLKEKLPPVQTLMLDLHVPAVSSDAVIPKTGGGETVDEGILSATPEEIEMIAKVKSLGSAHWFALSKWAKETNNFQGRVRAFLYKIGEIIARGWEITPKQAKWALELLEQAVNLGFRC